MGEDYVRIFDTTLRDGEQSAGINLNTAEKLQIAYSLARMNIDVIEAGFPAASPGDLQAVQEIACLEHPRERAGGVQHELRAHIERCSVHLQTYLSRRS